MTGRWPFTAEKIATRLELIGPYINTRSVALDPFRICPLPEAMVDAPICHDPAGWDEIAHESYWGHADLNFVMKSAFTIPDGWDAGNTALFLPLGVLGDIFNHPEALVHVDRQPIGSADRYHHTLPLDPALADGQRHVLSLHGWTGLASWPPNPNSKAKLFMGTPQLVERDPMLLAFHRRARTVLDTLRQLDPESDTHHALLQALDAAFKVLDTRDPIGPSLHATVPQAFQVLEAGIPAAGAPLDVTLHGIGHAHMDIAYLWPVSQIRLKNARTYSNVLRLMKEDPAYHFSHSQPALYEMTAQDYPAIFEQIKTRVAEGRWEVMGGMWVEPDLNIPGGEALVRQLTLGRGYFRDTFGDVETPVLWLPDTFGFPAQIPQLMKLAGLRWFVTNKLNWNQRNKVPSSTHTWEGIDGSRVLAHVLTTPREVQYLPFPTNYKSDLSAAEVMGTWTNSTAQSHVSTLPICFGYGDGGGGPTEELVAKAHAYANMPGMPELKMSTVRAAFDEIEQGLGDLPVWQGEHYMEGHRGVFTSQGWIKRANRKAEWALHEAEALAALAGVQIDLTEAWKLLCLNQFHDIVTGTSVTVVFEDARKDFARLRETVEREALKALDALGDGPLAVANTCPTTGPRLASIDGGDLALFDALPAYSVTPVSKAVSPAVPARATAHDGGAVLENATLKVMVAPTGQLISVHDKVTDREVLKEGAVANHLQAFEDRPICWDAWDIDSFFEDRQDVLDDVTEFSITENGPLRAAVRIKLKWRSSTVVQTIRLAAHSNRIDFETEVDWHETHTLLKAAFPVSVTAKKAQFDVQWGRIERATTRDNAFDAARFEVPAQKWAQLREDGYAVALLNDCKYGYDVREDTLRITLIKSATSPDPVADQGLHRFTYALLPIPGGDPAVLDHEAYDLNAPLRAVTVAERAALVQVGAPNVVIETVKPAEDGTGIIVRLFEAHGQAAHTSVRFGKPVAAVSHVSLMEQTLGPADPDAITLTPFEIVSLRVEFA